MDHSTFSGFRRFGKYLRKWDMEFMATAMSPRWYFMDFYVYPPLIVLGLLVALDGGVGRMALSGGLVVLGLAVWTLAEYLIHRFAFHHFPGLQAVHLEHHAEPDGLHGSPTVVSVVAFAGLAFAPLWYLIGLPSAAALTVGVMMGYLAYAAVHYAVHHVTGLGPRWIRPQLRALIKAHAVHHHQFTSNFGVTTTLWDRVFGTYFVRDQSHP